MQSGGQMQGSGLLGRSPGENVVGPVTSIHLRGAAEFGRALSYEKDARSHVKQVMGANDQLAKPQFVRNLAWVYGLCMALVIVLCLAGQVIVTVISEQNHTDGRVVNVAGRQRMLSQIVSKDALALLYWEGNPLVQSRYTKELADALREWQKAHVGLLHGGDSLPGSSDGTVHELFAKLEPTFQTMYGAGVGLLTVVTGKRYDELGVLPPAEGIAVNATLQGNVDVIIALEPAFLAQMNDIVLRFQVVGENHLQLLLIITWVITGVVIATLVLEGLFVIRPVLKKTHMSLSERFDLLRASLEAEAGARSVSVLMVGYIGHELLEPLGSIQRNLKYVQTQLKQMQTVYCTPAGGALQQACKTTEDTVKESQAACSMMATVINDVMDMRQLEGGRLTLLMAPVDVSKCTRHVASMVKPRLGVQLRCEVDPAVEGKKFVMDRHRLTQILLNLVTNAVKFTHTGTITLRCLLVDKRLRFEVVDTGVGMSEDACAKVFMPFIETPLDKTFAGGTGLGLYICKLLSDLMGGTVGVNSRVGEGSTFWFVLPAHLEGTSPLSESSMLGGSSHGSRNSTPDGSNSSQHFSSTSAAPYGKVVEHPEEERAFRSEDELETTTQGGGRCHRGGHLLSPLVSALHGNTRADVEGNRQTPLQIAGGALQSPTNGAHLV